MVGTCYKTSLYIMELGPFDNNAINAATVGGAIGWGGLARRYGPRLARHFWNELNAPRNGEDWTDRVTQSTIEHESDVESGAEDGTPPPPSSPDLCMPDEKPDIPGGVWHNRKIVPYHIWLVLFLLL